MDLLDNSVSYIINMITTNNPLDTTKLDNIKKKEKMDKKSYSVLLFYFL